MDHASTARDEVRAHGRELRRAIPEVYRGYAQLRTAALAPGALDVRTRSSSRSPSPSHASATAASLRTPRARRAGATEAEVAEALGVDVLMNGGPATVYGPAPSRPSVSSSPRRDLPNSPAPAERPFGSFIIVVIGPLGCLTENVGAVAHPDAAPVPAARTTGHDRPPSVLRSRQHTLS